jgi:hypothetical protein
MPTIRAPVAFDRPMVDFIRPGVELAAVHRTILWFLMVRLEMCSQ